MCAVANTVSEGEKGIQNKTKAINWGLLWRQRSSQKFFQLHPLSILVGFLCALGVFRYSYYPRDRKAMMAPCGELKMPESAAEDTS